MTIGIILVSHNSCDLYILIPTNTNIGMVFHVHNFTFLEMIDHIYLIIGGKIMKDKTIHRSQGKRNELWVSNIPKVASLNTSVN